MLPTHTILALSGTIIFGIMMGMLFFVAIPEENASSVNMALGALLGWVGAAFSFYFGDTQRSQQNGSQHTKKGKDNE